MSEQGDRVIADGEVEVSEVLDMVNDKAIPDRIVFARAAVALVRAVARVQAELAEMRELWAIQPFRPQVEPPPPNVHPRPPRKKPAKKKRGGRR